MKISIKKTWSILLTLSGVLLVHSCVDPLYDMSKGIDTEIKVGGDSLALPLGSTDTIRLGDFLSSDDMEFLKTMEDGGYGFTLSDSLSMDDILKSLDVSKLKFDDQVFAQNVPVSFGDIDIGDFKIPGFTKKDTLDMNIPSVTLGDIVPVVNISNNYAVSFSDFVMDESKLTVADVNQGNQAENLLANIPPLDTYNSEINPSFSFTSPTPIDIGDLSVNVTYTIEVPAGVTNIYQIDLEAGAEMEITMEMLNATNALSAGKFTPAIEIDPSNMFKFNPLTPLENGKITFGSLRELNNFNSYKSTKSYTIDAFHNLPAAVNDVINLMKTITVGGTIDAEGTVMENKVQEAKDIDLKVQVVIKDVKIKNLDFDVPSLTTTIDGTSPFNINNSDIPTQISKINKIYFGKVAGSPLSTNLVIEMKPADMPVMKTSDFKIANLNVTFPNNFAFSNLSGQTFAATNATFDPVTGYKIELNLSEIDLSSVSINSQVLNWSGNISYNGTIVFGGRMESKNINTSQNPTVTMLSSSAIKLNSATVTTNVINENIAASVIPIDLNIDITDQVKRLGIINVKPGCFIRVDIDKPTLPLSLQANGIQIAFSNLFEFKPTAGLSDNKFTINGNIPDFIQLELKALHINQDLNNGVLNLEEEISIGGGVTLLSGTVNSNDIQGLGDKKLVFEASVSDMFIESTSIEMKSLEASVQDSTSLDLEIADLPSELVSLDSLMLNSGGTIKLDIIINNMPSLGSNPLNANMKIKFPDILMFTAGSVNANNELVINEAFVNGKLSKTIGLRGLQFDGQPLNGALKIDDQISFDVTVSVEDPTINSDDLNGAAISVDVNVTLAGLGFKSVYGKFDVNMDDQLNIPDVALDILPDFLKGDDVVLDIAQPVISLRTESNLGIPIDAELSMTKIIGGVTQTDDKLTINFALPRTASPAEFVTTGYWVSPFESGKPEGYTFIEKPVQNIFKPIPDAFKIDLKPNINTTVQHFIDLSANYKMKVNYDIIIPFSFGKDLSIALRDTMDVDLDLGETNITTGGLELLAKVTNSIPLDLELELIILDANENILATPPTQTILAGAPDGSGVVSNIIIALDGGLGDLKDMKKIILNFKATSNTTVAGTPIRPENYIKADLKARVNGGITLKL